MRVINQIRQDRRFATRVFTTKAYQAEALRLVIQEANVVAKQLALPEELPITKSNIIKAFISPFTDAYTDGAIGTVTTRNYWYFISQGNKFSGLTTLNQGADCRRFQELYTWPLSRLDTNQACALALDFLSAASMDVQAIKRDCKMVVGLDTGYVHPPAGTFVPVYYIYWKPLDNHDTSVASVRLCTPTKTILQLKVRDPKYILRPPLVFTNLDVLLSETNLPPQRHGAAP